MRLGASSARTNDTAAENTLSNTIGVVGHTHQCPTPSLGAGHPPFLRKETTVYRMVYRESTWKEFRTDQRHRGAARSQDDARCSACAGNGPGRCGMWDLRVPARCSTALRGAK